MDSSDVLHQDNTFDEIENMHITLCTGAEPTEGDIFDCVSEYSLQYEQVAELSNAIHQLSYSINAQTINNITQVKQDVLHGFVELKICNEQILQKFSDLEEMVDSL